MRFWIGLYVFLIAPVQASIFAQEDPRLAQLQQQLNAIKAQLDGMLPPAAPAQQSLSAVVRQYSHGVSCTVVWTGQGKSLLLGCAHGYEGARGKAITLDVPTPNPVGQVKSVHPRLVALDERSDLSLVELPDGPLPYVMPIAPAGHRPSGRIISAGYDKMELPGVRVPVHLVSLQFTRERPVPGRSGGALYDADAGVLIGVCHGYECMPPVYTRGMYIDHRTILAFMQAKGYSWVVQGGQAAKPAQPYPPTRNYQQLQCPT